MHTKTVSIALKSMHGDGQATDSRTLLPIREVLGLPFLCAHSGASDLPALIESLCHTRSPAQKISPAPMAKLVDARDLKSLDLTVVPVRPRLGAPSSLLKRNSRGPWGFLGPLNLKRPDAVATITHKFELDSTSRSFLTQPPQQSGESACPLSVSI